MSKSKNLSLILCGCAVLFAAVVFATMAGDIFAATDLGSIGSFNFGDIEWGSVYNALGAEEPIGVLVAALVVFIVGFVVVLGALVLTLLKNKFAKYVTLGACLILIVAGILYFCPATGDYSDFELGIGSILSGVFCLLGGIASGASGVMELKK